MAKDPAFLFYYQDFLVGTTFLTNEEVGAYIRILCHLADKGVMSEKEMLKICGTTELLNSIIGKFKQDDNGMYYNERLNAEMEKRRAFSESRRKNRYSQLTSVEHMSNICQTYVEEVSDKSLTSVEHMSDICQTSVEHMSNICRTSVEHMENENENISSINKSILLNKENKEDKILVAENSFVTKIKKNGEVEAVEKFNRIVDDELAIKRKEIVEKWNAFAVKYALAQIIEVGEKRRKSLNARLKEKRFDFNKILQKVEQSEFLLGRSGSKRSWKIHFDFIISNGQNYIKILEGRYDTTKSSTEYSRSYQNNRGKGAITQDNINAITEAYGYEAGEVTAQRCEYGGIARTLFANRFGV